ncbi:hypothetical protein E4T66_11630 [Sinimarinibacterium sp. CAU 1509]|uniref:OmpP1/FadL family transporter n=1 Tax=Sinimarinibacterium sp. CAU 1509 TaxID=2562283 RepID=UPI0010ABE293|nr:outer membrane protein transport protein [Sinimarinibacterium sp. CAU 1509]TJY59829.1 hypothetical protein E4T66_11630 [Sinimarinibacterium sp. CAU 1509]
MNKIEARLLAGLALAAAVPAHATNGYFSHGYGTQSKAMAGTGVALSLDALAPATNPAAIAFTGDRNDIGLGLFSPVRSYEVSGQPSGACASQTQCTFGIGPQSIESDAEYFPIPHLGLTRKIDEHSAWGMAIYGNGGMNTRYKGGTATFGAPTPPVPPGSSVTAPGTFGDGTAGVDLIQLFIATTYAREFAPGASWGIAPIFAYQRFEARGLGNFAPFSSDPQHLSDNGHDDAYGGGVRIGIQAAVTDQLRVGASYQSRIYMTEFKDYAGLFAEQGDMDIPSNATLGLALDATPALTVAFDVQYIAYSEIKAVGNSMLPNLATAQMGDDNGAGFGWDDMTIYKLGARWKASDDLSWMAGYSYGEQPIPDSEVLFNVLAPGVIEQHFTVGLVSTLFGHEVSASLMYAPEKTVSGTNPLDPAQTIDLKMYQTELEFNFAF